MRNRILPASILSSFDLDCSIQELTLAIYVFAFGERITNDCPPYCSVLKTAFLSPERQCLELCRQHRSGLTRIFNWPELYYLPNVLQYFPACYLADIYRFAISLLMGVKTNSLHTFRCDIYAILPKRLRIFSSSIKSRCVSRVSPTFHTSLKTAPLAKHFFFSIIFLVYLTI